MLNLKHSNLSRPDGSSSPNDHLSKLHCCLVSGWFVLDWFVHTLDMPNAPNSVLNIKQKGKLKMMKDTKRTCTKLQTCCKWLYLYQGKAKQRTNLQQTKMGHKQSICTSKRSCSIKLWKTTRIMRVCTSPTNLKEYMVSRHMSLHCCMFKTSISQNLSSTCCSCPTPTPPYVVVFVIVLHAIAMMPRYYLTFLPSCASIPQHPTFC